jgi:hypothetical protein
MVETMRGGGLAAGISPGCSWCATNCSPVPLPLASAWPGAPAWLGTVLIGPSAGLMIGGSAGSTELPNMAR